MKRLTIVSRSLVLLVVGLLFSASLSAQVFYGYGPDTAPAEELSAIGGGKNEFVQGMVCFDPSEDPVLARMKEQEKVILGVRCRLRADYKQARQKRSAVLASTGTPANFVRTTFEDFTEGWNNVLFDEPLPIGDEPIYLGVQVYETIGTPYPLMTYALATVPKSCFINLAKSTWEEMTDRGTLLVEAIVSDDAATCFECTTYAQNTTHPQTVAPDADFTGGLYIHNFSATPITSVEIAMQGEGAEQPTLRTIELPQPVEAYASTVVQTQLRSGSAEGTNVGWTATVTQINGVPAQTARPGTTSLYVTRDNFIRTPLVEEFTSQRCVNCPQMAYFLEKAFEEYNGPYVYLAHHSGFAEDVFTSDVDREMVYVFGGYTNEYNPAIMYNRAVFEGENTIVQGIRDMSPTPYLEALAIAADMPAMAEIRINVDDAVHVTGRVAHDLVETPLYLSCYLVEDGISPDRYPQIGLTGDADAPADLQAVFRHNGVILHHFTSDPLGDLLAPDADGNFDLQFPLIDKEGFGGTARRVVALVHRINKTNLRENTVLNSAQAYLGADGMREIHHSQFISHHGAGVLYDLSGREVHRTSVHTLSPGIYIQNGKKIVIGSR